MADTFLDKIIVAGMKVVQDNIAKLQAMGLMDNMGKLLNVQLPLDMSDDLERDFGG